MTDLARARRGRRPTKLVVALAASVLLLAGCALEDGDAQPERPPVKYAEAKPPVQGPRILSTSAKSDRTRPVTPDSITIPRLDVRAAVLPISAVDRSLTPPPDPQTLGWWRDGARPGDAAGTAVLTGHTVHTGGGALDDLEDLAPGDTFSVSDGRSQLSYDVTSVEVISTAEVASRHRDLFRQDGPHRLMLVTCEDWDGDSYLSSVIVLAAPRPER